MRRYAVSYALAALLGAASAQPVGHVPSSKLLDLLGTAQRRILVYVPYLTDLSFADALRIAKNDPSRPKLQVILITVPFFAAKSDALSNGLALAGVPVVEAQVSSTTAYVLVDDRLFSSKTLGRVANANDVQLMSLSDTNTFLGWFKNAAKAGTIITAYQAFTRIGGNK